MIEESPSENPKGEKSKKGELSMLGKFYNINSQTLASGDIMTLATSRTCGCGIKLEGNEIVISTPGSYLIGVSVTAAQTSTTAQGVRLLVSTPSGVTVQSEGGSASSSDATAGNVRTLAFSDTVRVCKSCCCGKTRLSLLTTGAMTIDNVIITVARI